MKKTISSTVLVLLVVAVLTSTIGVAWLSDRGLSSPIDITSNLRKSYFQSGDGSKVTPYEIATPVQLYYFSWLQYLGYFNEVGENNQVKTFYFTVSHDLDMTGYTLPPIGTKDQPFLGNFDGGGKIISNLTIENRYNSLIDPPANTNGDNFGGVEIIGFFGVIGALEGDVSYSYATLENQVKDLVLENITVKTQTDTALIGLVAGYVNGTVDCVGVVNATVDIKSGTKATTLTANLSDYALIGYCAENFKDKMYSLDLSLYDPATNTYQVIPDMSHGGEGTGWGGSVKMKDIFTWLDTLNSSGSNRNGLTTSTTYTLERVDVITLGNKYVTVDTSNPTTKQTYVREKFGAFVFTNTQPNHVNFVSGGQKVTQFKYAYTEDQVPLYHIIDGNNYLRFDGNSLTATTSESSATGWYREAVSGGYNIYTVVGTTIYYLDLSNNNLVVLADTDIENHSALPVWTVSDGDLMRNSKRIEYNSGSWKVVTTASSYLISSGDNYLSLDDTAIGNQTEENATGWTIEFPSNNKAVISTKLTDGSTRYLSATATDRNGGNLQLVNSRTEWTYAADSRGEKFSLSLRYNNYQSRTYYLSYNNGDWVVRYGESSVTLTEVWDTMSLDETQETADKIVCEKTEYIDNSTQNYTYDENGNKVINSPAGITYFPLSTTVDVKSQTFTISSGNTGYIIGAEWGAIENNEHDQYGNIRISSYGGGSILNKEKPYTISYKTQGKFKTIPKVFDGENLLENGKATLANLGLQKYADCYVDYSTSVLNSCDGLHFMQAAVSMSNIATIPYAYLNGTEYENYQVPTNCIDFNLYEQGFINFIAGSYFTNNGVNNSFFSLYEIERNDDNEITAIKEIYKIYAKCENGVFDTTEPYVYTYQQLKEGSEAGKKENILEVGTVPDGYEPIFDCMWMIYPDSSEYYGTGVSEDPTKWVATASSGSTNPTGYAYYYEVPVNAGEYAIGSSAGRIGAYLVYLDLAANAQIVERTRVDEKIVTEECASTIPKGVSILEKNPDGYNTPDIQSKYSTFVSIGADWSGSAMFSQTGNVVTDSAIDGHTAVFIGHGLELKNGNGVPMAVPITPKVTTVNRSTYYDVNLVTEVKTVTVIQTITVNEAGQTKVSYTKQVTVTDADGQVTVGEEETFDDQVFPDVPDPTTDPPTEPEGSPLLQMQYVVSVKDAFAPDFHYERETTEGESTIAPTYTITFQNKTGEDMPVRMELTSAGRSSKIVFTVKDGTKDIVLDKEQSGVQNITVKKEEAVSS